MVFQCEICTNLDENVFIFIYVLWQDLKMIPLQLFLLNSLFAPVVIKRVKRLHAEWLALTDLHPTKHGPLFSYSLDTVHLEAKV